jgi:hypothetical protein
MAAAPQAMSGAEAKRQRLPVTGPAMVGIDPQPTASL